MSGSVRLIYVTQDDLSKHSGYAFRVDRLRRAFERAGAQVCVAGYRSGEPAIACSAVRTSSPLRRLVPLLRGLLEPADAAILTSIGAPYNGLYALALRICGKRVIYDMHDPVRYSLPELFGRNLPMRAAMRLIAFSERLLDSMTSATIASSQAARDLYRGHGWRGPILTAYNIRAAAPQSAETARSIREGSWRDAVVVVYAGGLQRGIRGIEQQIAAIREARRRGVDAVLLLLGFGERAYFEELGADLLREGAMRVLPDVEPAQMDTLLRQCDLAVSSEPVGYLMQSKYFDYLRCGVRVVAVADGRDLVQTFGGLVDTYDGSTADLVRYLTHEPARMDPLAAARARERIAELDAMADAGAVEILLLRELRRR